ncbi:DUF305 domain-containing protein [Streptomyces sp. NPDC005438]|uniref:DUF305 domain-containing protein n=1 Tax=Streptomyces sp. NPDC005438 TaxID=3156880 RepID=UPI0033A0F6E3
MSVRRSIPRALAATVAALTLLSACGGGDDGDGDHSSGHSDHSSSASPSDSGKGHNNQDVAFSQGMIPHHRQAVEMSELAPSRDASPEVAKLAGEIKKAQAPEITTMSGWLKGWGRPVPKEDDSAHTGHGMPGMVTAKQMAELRKAKGAAFDRTFLKLMVEHHKGAVVMSRAEESAGKHGPSKKLAGEIVTAQRKEIKTMNSLLDKG